MAKGCSVPGCTGSHVARGLCNAHLKRFLRYGDVQAHRPVSRRQPGKPCSVKGCDAKAVARTWCVGHLKRFYKTGDIQANVPLKDYRKKDRFVTGEGYVLIRVPEDTPGRNYRGMMLEHRWVMQNAIGRPLLPYPLESVHHKDGNREHNVLENLELRVGAHGPGATEAHCSTCSCFDDHEVLF